ncbi:MAG: histidine kinase dimerization/phosphoacceptor domain -containing protein [Gracilimonas sp.]
MSKSITSSEKKRLEALYSYDILDTEEEKEFDNLVKLAAQICDVPFAKLNFLDEERSWSKANYGNDIKETPKEVAFCYYTIQDESHMVVEDTLEDDRFKNSAFVVESPNVRFYAGVNVKGNDQNLGTICVLGQEPKKLSESQLEALNILANEVESRLELKRKNKELATLTAFLEASVEAMLIVDPKSNKVEHSNSNGNSLLSKLFDDRDRRPIDELFPDWDYLAELKKWDQASDAPSFKMETSIETNDAQTIHLEINTAKKYGKWLITLQDITKRKEAEVDLIQEKKVSDAIINALPIIFYMFDEEMNLIRWNENMTSNTGYSDKEMKKLNPLDFFEGEDIGRIQDQIKKTMSGSKGIIEADLVKKDGSKEPFIFNAVPFHDHNKKFLLGTGQSISDQVEYQNQLKNLVKEKEVLIQEVHHRVKNNLAVISSFLQLQELISEEEEVKAILASNYMRVKSMALIHDELYKANDFSGINFEHYLTEILALLQEKLSPKDKDVKLNISSESIYMNLNQAVPLALIINELVSNAFTYAFEGRDSGNIWVRLKLKGDHIHMSIKDDGIGLPDGFKFEESPTLGTTLIMSYSDQIEAEVNISTEEGTHYELRFENKKAKTGSNFHIAL